MSSVGSQPISEATRILDNSTISAAGAPAQCRLDLILHVAGDSRGRVLDVGGGQSFLVDRLLDAGFEHVEVLDISQTAIEATQARLGERASQVEWIVADITERDALGKFDV